MNILGVWDGHDSGAALLVDGTIVAAVNEERLSRRKLEVRFPAASIRACLDIAGLEPRAVDVVAACGSDVSKTLARVVPSTKESYYLIRRRLVPPGRLNRVRKSIKYRITEWGPNPVSRTVTRLALGAELRRLGLHAATLVVHDHHVCHAAAGACTSGFDEATVVTIDGVGDGRSSTVSAFRRGRLDLVDSTPASHSAGIFFEHVTNLLNMRELEDEGKVMALAHYASPLDSNPLREVLRVDGLRLITTVPGHALYAHLRQVHWRFPNEQFAWMAQDAVERACVELVGAAVNRTGLPRVVLAGGVASNIRLNRLIRLLPVVDDVYVFPHMGDGGLAVGAAMMTSLSQSQSGCQRLQSLALGPEFDSHTMRTVLEEAGLRYAQPQDMGSAVADLLCGNDVVFWFQGRMEYGPRALGCRSILARADAPEVRDRLNLVLKRRVWYQPFCPTILENDAMRLLSDWKGSPDRFMTMAYSVHRPLLPLLSGVVGVDGTCRPQIVPEDAVTPMAGVLHAMRARTSVGAVLNTSFNIHGEPLVCSPEQAVDVFLRSGADALVLGPFLVQRGEDPGR